jgi:hypothetical protein
MSTTQIPLKLTPPAELLRMAEFEQANKDANIAHFRRMLAAANEPGFSGDLHRAINSQHLHPRRLADECGVDWRVLEDFRSGDATLSSDVIDRLVQRLGIKVSLETNDEIPIRV